MNIDLSWQYTEVISNLKTLKKEYEEILTSFSYIRDENKFIREIKDKIYSFDFNVNKIDKIWEYMNNDLSPLEIFIFFKFLE